MGSRGGGSHGGAGGIPGNLSKVYGFFKSAYGAKHARNIIAILSQAPQQMQDLFARYAHKLDFDKLLPGDERSAAYFDPKHEVVRLNIDYVARGGNFGVPYETVFHEYGHMIDWITGEKHSWGTVSSSSVARLGVSARDELNNLLNGIVARYADKGVDTREKAAKALIKKITRENTVNGILNIKAVSDISDMLEGAGIGINAPLGAGHNVNGKKYWEKWTDRTIPSGLEIYAEMTSATVSNNESLKVIRQYFPKTYKKYMEIVNKKNK